MFSHMKRFSCLFALLTAAATSLTAVALAPAELGKNAIASADFTRSSLLKKIDLGCNLSAALNVTGLAQLNHLNCFEENRSRPSLRPINLSGTVRLRELGNKSNTHAAVV
jgi:hypothetical protein